MIGPLGHLAPEPVTMGSSREPGLAIHLESAQGWAWPSTQSTAPWQTAHHMASSQVYPLFNSAEKNIPQFDSVLFF